MPIILLIIGYRVSSGKKWSCYFQILKYPATLGAKTSNQATAAEVAICLLWRHMDTLFKKAIVRWWDKKRKFILAKDLVKFLSVNLFISLDYDKNKTLISSV